MVCVAAELVEGNTAEVWRVPSAHASIPSGTSTVACVVFVGGVTSTVCVDEHVPVAVWTSLNPTLKYADWPTSSVTWLGAISSKASSPPRVTVVGNAAPEVLISSIPG